MKQPRIVRHRWNLPLGQEPPQPGDTIRGRSKAHSWRVLEVIPVESPTYPNAWVGRLECTGPWQDGDDSFRWWYRRANEAA